MSKRNIIDEQRTLIATLREQLSDARGQLRGREDGRADIAVQLADRNTELTRQRDAAARGAERATGDVRRALRMVAGHVLDVQAGAEADDSIRLLLDEFMAAGLPLRAILIQLQAERAEATVTVSATAAAAAVATAPRTGPFAGPLPPAVLPSS